MKLLFTNPVMILLLLMSGCEEEPVSPPYQSNNSSWIAEGTYPTVSPDGKRIAFFRNDKIFMVDINGANLVQLTNNDVTVEIPQWSYDGKKIGFVQVDRSNSANTQLKMIDLSTKVVTAISITDTLWKNGADLFDWHWSPDGKNVGVFVKSNEKNLRILKSDGSGETIGKYGVTEFSWSPDGTKMVCANYVNSDSSCLYLATIGEDSLARITTRKFGFKVQWLFNQSTNENIIVYHAGAAGLIYYDPVLNEEIKNVPIPANYKISPDGNNIAYVHSQISSNPDAASDYSIININTVTNTTTHIVTANRFLFFNWMPSSKEIVYGFEGKIFTAPILQ